MRSFTIVSTLALAVVFLAAIPHPAWCSPINWDNVNLTKEQEQTVQRVDGLLNDFLKQLEEGFKRRNPQWPHVGRRVKVVTSEYPEHLTEDSVDAVTTPTGESSEVAEVGGCGGTKAPFDPVKDHSVEGVEGNEEQVEGTGYVVRPPLDPSGHHRSAVDLETTEGTTHTNSYEVDSVKDDRIWFPDI